MLKNKRIALLMSTVLVAVVAVGCGSDNSTESSEVKITISGSTSVGPSMDLLAEEFETKNEGISIEIQQLGSSAGIKNAIDGTSEIGMASRDLKDEEKNTGLQETEIALDAIALITNSSNEVKDLTMEQIKGIYTGKITNWSEVGGKDAPIVVVSREDGSGTRGAFEEIVGYESAELTKDAQISDGSGNIKSMILGNENAIGYISSSYVDETVTGLTVGGEELTVDNVKSGKYALARPFLLVNKQEISEQANNLIEFVLSEEGQSILENEGLISIR